MTDTQALPFAVRWRHLARQASYQHGVFNRDQAHDLGVDNRAIRSACHRGVVVDTLPGVFRFPAAAPTWRSRLSAASLTGAGGRASHRAASVLQGLDGFTTAPVEILTERGAHAQIPDAIVHRWTGLEPQDLVWVDGIACTSVAATLAMLGAVVPEVQVEQALDGALRQGHSIAWLEETANRLHRPGPSGTSTLLRLLEDPVRQGLVPDSFFERLCQRILIQPTLPRPELQFPVDLGDRVVRIDIAWPEIKYGIECHSRTFHFGPQAETADNVRDHRLGAAGWHLDYVTWRELQRPDHLMAQIAAVHTQRTLQLDPGRSA